MRLTETQQEALHTACRRHFGEAAALWLFGSRADDRARGGDIDLYLETPETDSDKLMAAKLAFLVALDRELGEQKIDLVIRRLGDQEEQPIHRIARSTGVRLL